MKKPSNRAIRNRIGRLVLAHYYGDPNAGRQFRAYLRRALPDPPKPKKRRARR